MESIAHAFVGGSIAGAAYGYGHDASGKVTGVTISHDSFEWAPGVSYARGYGAVDNLNQVASETQGSTVRPIEFDLNGNMTEDGINGYQWTHGTRLIGVTRPGATTSYGYDSDDRRTYKSVGGVMTRTLWSGADEVAQTDGAGNIQQRFIPDGSGAMDGRLAQISPSGSIAWYHADHQGSVIASSLSVGQIQSARGFSPSGEMTYALPAGGVFGYAGRQFDSESGLYQYRARYYHPRLGQFLSPDPSG